MYRDDAMDYRILYEKALADNTRLRAAHQRIIDLEPATQELTVANLMAAESKDALKDTTP